MVLRASRTKTYYLVLAVIFLSSLLAFAYVGHFTRYMADDYCLAAKVHQLGFAGAQMRLYKMWTGRYSYSFLMSVAELIGPSTVPVGPFLALICWQTTAIWLLHQLALIARCPHPLLTAILLAELIIFAMLNAADNIVQSFYWQGGLVNYVAPLILLTTYAGIVTYAVRKKLRRRSALPLVLLSALVTFLAGGFTEAYGVMQTGGIFVLLIVCYRYAAHQLRRAMLPFLIAGLISSLTAISIVTLAPGNKFRQSYFPPPPNLFRLTRDSLYYTINFAGAEFVGAPLTILSLLLLPALLAFRVERSKSPRDRNANVPSGALLLLLSIGFLLIFLCFFTGVYAVSGPLPDRACFIPEFIFVCTVVCWSHFGGQALAQRFSRGESKSTWSQNASLLAVGALILAAPLLATWRTLRLVPQARGSALIWDQMDNDVRAAKARGARDLIVPAVNDVETRLGAPRTELQIESDPLNWKNKCVARYYEVDSITGR